MRTFFIGLLLLGHFAGLAQTKTIIGYRSSTMPGNQPLIFALYSDGSRRCVTSLPANRPNSRVGGVVKLAYAPEPKRVLNADQFGLDKYYSPNFKFSVDFRNITESVDDKRRQGVNLFGNFTVTEPERYAMPFGQGLVYDTESGLHGPLEGVAYFENPLAVLERRYQTHVSGAEKGYWVANIETSSEWYPGNTGSAYPGFPAGRTGSYGTAHSRPWNDSKNISIVCEVDGVTRTLEQLANAGYLKWEAEKNLRRANRVILLLQMARQKSPAGGLCAYGASMYQGQPVMNTAYATNVFNAGNAKPTRSTAAPGTDPANGIGTTDIGNISANVASIGGDPNGNITLNGTQYTIRGDIYSNETFHLDYYYQFTFGMNRSDYDDIWVNRNPAKQNYESIWAAIKTRHVVADQVGHWQANRHRMLNRSGQTVRPTIMMRELMYELDIAGYVDGIARIGRVPEGLGTGSLDQGEGRTDQPKIWIPPYEMYSYYAVQRFLEGGNPGSGFHLFNAPGRFDFANTAGFNQVFHSVSALFQARADLQVYERFLDNSTMEQQPEVKADQAGTWQRYDAIQAYNYNEGTFGTQRPVYVVRYAPVAGGWRVVILGGHNLRHDEERTDLVRMPGGLLNNNQFQIKLRGPAAQVFEFIVSDQDTGQTYQATPTPQVGYERAGYAGRIGQD